MDKIIIKDLKLYAYHGVNPEEKEEGQNFFLDITCFLDLNAPCADDNVDSTVSYAKILKLIRKVFCREKYDLIEKAAQVTAEAILHEFEKIKKVVLLLKKPEAPVKADCAYVAVEITREK